MEGYIKGALLGQGTFGKVHQYTSKELGVVVAIKKIHLQEAKEGVNMTALREIKLLRELHHARLVQLFDVFSHKANLYLVFEYCESDLEQLIKDRRTLLSAADIKAYMHMILAALHFCHRNWVLHRDIKPNNFLITKQGDLKLGDFGLARIYGSPDRRLTSQVFALWYRAPELLFGSFCYGPGVDIWAAGCIFAELMLRRPWFQPQTPQGLHSAPTEIGTLREIFGALGTPTPESWPDADTLPNYMRFTACPGQPLRAAFPQASEDALELLGQTASEDALELLGQMMSFDPRQRITAGQALQHRFFSCDPLPTPVDKLPRAPVRASNPLVMEAQGGSALQKAPGEQPQRPSNLLDAGEAVDVHPSPSSGDGREQGPETSGSHAVSDQASGWGTISKVTQDRPPIADKDLRALRKRKFDLTAAVSPVALSPA